MERKNVFLTLLVFAMTFACAPILAQAASQGDTPPAKPGMRPAPPRPGSVDAAAAQRAVSGPYRVTYTLTEMDGTKRVGSEHYAIVMDADARPSHVNLQSYIPVPIGSSAGTKYTQEKLSLRIDANLRQFANGMELSTEVQQTTFANGANDSQTSDYKPPVTRDAFFGSTTLVTENEPATLGELDIPGSTHSLQIQVKLTRVP